MDMPEVLQMLIQDFARPVIRPDWRTCKALEANSIREYHDWYNPLVYDDPYDEVYDTEILE